jgi:hypothetical protein
MNDSQINGLLENAFINLMREELYRKLTEMRELFNLPKLYVDNMAEIAIDDYFASNYTRESQLIEKLNEVL